MMHSTRALGIAALLALASCAPFRPERPSSAPGGDPRVSAVMMTPGCVAFWGFTKRETGGAHRFTIGRVIHSGRSVGFTGWIGGVAVFDRALTGEEIKRLYELIPRSKRGPTTRTSASPRTPRAPVGGVLAGLLYCGRDQEQITQVAQTECVFRSSRTPNPI